MKNPKISIITVVKNNQKLIERNILSLLNQKYKNYEHIIIDGGSTDGSKDIIQNYSQKISHFVSEPDDGIYDAMNKGLDLASGDIVGILNSDDYFYENALQTVKTYFENMPQIEGLEAVPTIELTQGI